MRSLQVYVTLSKLSHHTSCGSLDRVSESAATLLQDLTLLRVHACVIKSNLGDEYSKLLAEAESIKI